MAKKTGIKKIFSAILTGILILSTLLCLVLVTKVVIGEEPSILGFRMFYIVSGSMEPEIPINALVLVKKQPTYQLGDTITFKSGNPEIQGMPNTHVIVDVIEDGDNVKFRTKGVANREPDDELVPQTDVYGKVVFHTGKAKWLSDALAFMLTPAGFMVVIVVPIMLIGLIAMKDFLKTLKAETEKSAKLPEEPECSPEEKDESEVEQ